MREGAVEATRQRLLEWVRAMERPGAGAMEATRRPPPGSGFTGWVCDFLKPRAVELQAAHPQMLRAIAACQKKNDRVDAGKIADLLRGNLLPPCHVASEETRELRRVLRCRNLLVRQAVVLIAAQALSSISRGIPGRLEPRAGKEDITPRLP